MDLDVTFNGVAMKTPIYIKAHTSEQLLLGEGVCRQLEIISYHPEVSDRKGRKWNQHTRETPKTNSGQQGSRQGGVSVPTTKTVDNEVTKEETKKTSEREELGGVQANGEEVHSRVEKRRRRELRQITQGDSDPIVTTGEEQDREPRDSSLNFF